MKAFNITVYPITTTTTESRSTRSLNDPLLITYDQSGPKSAEELLFEAASQSDENQAKYKWKKFTKKVNEDYLTKKEIQTLIQNLDKKKQWSALHYAVANNNHFVAKILLEDAPYKCDINILGGNGENALHVAAQSSKLWNIQIDQQEKSVRSYSTINNAIFEYDSPSSVKNIPLVVRMLIERTWFGTRIQIDHEDDEGRTPLHLAVMANRYAFVCYLLNEANAHIGTATKMNANVFHFMFAPSEPMQSEQDLDTMFDLLMRTAKYNKKSNLLQSRTLDNQSPLVIAVSHAHCTEHIIKILMEGADNHQLLLTFDFAAKRQIAEDKLPLLKLLLAGFHGDTRYYKYQLIQIACRRNHVSMLKYLIKTGTFNEYLNKKNDRDYTPLLTAVFYEAKDCVEYLLKETQIDWKEQNHDGETVLHILAKSENNPDLFKLIWNKLKSEEIKDVMNIKDNTGNTSLHNAVYSNQLDICEHLLGTKGEKIERSQVVSLVGEKNARGRTPAHVASEMGFKDIVKCFWEATGKDRKGGLFKRDDDRKSCLHLAAAEGHLHVVEYLIEQVQMEVDIIADRRTTPLHLACQYGHSEIVQYLLQHKASPTLRTAQLYNCLEIAIMNYHDKLVRDVLFDHPLWRTMMRNAQPIKGTEAYDTPMRKLIRYMPKVTIHVIETKLTRTVGGPEQNVFKRIYDYEFFQDELVVERWYTQGAVLEPAPDTFRDRYKKLTWSETVRCAFCCFGCSNTNDNNGNSKPYTDNSYTLVRNNPLFIVAQQSSCFELMHHPFNINLRQQKMFMFGVYLLILSFLLYSTYLGIFTALVLQGRHPQYFYNLINVSYTEDLSTCEYVSNTLVNANVAEVFKSDTNKRLQVVAFVFLSLFAVKNVVLVTCLFPKIIRMGANYLELSVLILSFVYILDWYSWLIPVILRCPVQYQIGSFGLLLAWINFLTYLRYIPFRNIGVYVVMLQTILSKFIDFLPVLLVIICGFGFTFWMLLQNQSVYGTPIEALIRTGLMMFDLGYEDRLYSPDDSGICYYTVVYVMFVLTGIVLCIFVINLMISVAVGEIPSLKEQSIIWRHQMMYNALSDYEILRIQLRHVVDVFTCGYLNRTQQRGPHGFKFLQRRQDLTMYVDEKNVFWALRFKRYIHKHFFAEQIQDNVEIPVDKDKSDDQDKTEGKEKK